MISTSVSPKARVTYFAAYTVSSTTHQVLAGSIFVNMEMA